MRLTLTTVSGSIRFSHLGAAKSTMQETLRYKDRRLQKGMYVLVHHYNYIRTSTQK